MYRIPIARRLWFMAVVIALFASCKTVPQQLDSIIMEESGAIPLEPGAAVYLFADVKAARPILELVNTAYLDSRQARQMLARTRYATAALYPPESGRNFQLAAWGNYPAFRAGLALGAAPDWKKMPAAAGPYWYSAQDRLSLALNSRRAFVVSAAAPAPPAAPEPGIAAPEGFVEFSRGAALSCWLENPGPLLNQKLKEQEVPIELPAERIFVLVAPSPESAAENRYEVLLKMRFSSETQARALATLFAIARNLLPADLSGNSAALTALLFAQPPVQEGKNLIIKTAALNAADIALLFEFFSLQH